MVFSLLGTRFWILVFAAGALALGGCGYANPKSRYPSRSPGTPVEYQGPGAEEKPSIFGSGGIGGALFGSDTGNRGDQGGGGIGVNFYLWRASLDTISFMPLASADPFGGVIITDWYAPADSGGERIKLTVYILSRALRADGLRVAVFRQRRDAAGSWLDEPVDPTTATALEDAILTRARQMRIASAESQ
ncbi:MAG: DUF3576 domain-containing protein [Alphaproteobacteria bacterium]|nr:DUF3576 domain-containing protein [Alphaproteobacteria bacterium]